MAFFEFMTGRRAAGSGEHHQSGAAEQAISSSCALGMFADHRPAANIDLFGGVDRRAFVRSHRRHHDGGLSRALGGSLVGISLLLGCRHSARPKAYFVAFAKIPSFISSRIGGMLIFRGLTGNILLGQFVGTVFPKDFQAISSGFIPDFVSEPLGTAFRQWLHLRSPAFAGPRC